MNWYYVDEAGKQAGPVDDGALNALAASGRINSETLVWREGMANWQPLQEAKPGAASAGGPGVSAAGGGEAVCAECGGLFPVDDTIRIGNARVCANCKPVFVQKMREGVSVEAAGALRYAGFWIRFAAKFVDGIIVGVIVAIPLVFYFSAVAKMRSSGDQSQLLLLQMAFQVGVRAITVVYSGFFLGKFGATPGKMACGIKVVLADGSKISYGRAFCRGLAEIVSGLVCCIGYIMAGFDSEKRSLHDRMCNTRVVFK